MTVFETQAGARRHAHASASRASASDKDVVNVRDRRPARDGRRVPMRRRGRQGHHHPAAARSRATRRFYVAIGAAEGGEAQHRRARSSKASTSGVDFLRAVNARPAKTHHRQALCRHRRRQRGHRRLAQRGPASDQGADVNMYCRRSKDEEMPADPGREVNAGIADGVVSSTASWAPRTSHPRRGRQGHRHPSWMRMRARRAATRRAAASPLRSTSEIRDASPSRAPSFWSPSARRVDLRRRSDAGTRSGRRLNGTA